MKQSYVKLSSLYVSAIACLSRGDYTHFKDVHLIFWAVLTNLICLCVELGNIWHYMP